MKKYNWIKYLFVATAIGYIILNFYLRSEALKKNHLVVCARILSIKCRRRGDLADVHFQFVFNGKLVEDNGCCSDELVNEYNKGLRNHILLAVAKNDSSINDLLYDVDNYKRYNITTQDTIGVLCSSYKIDTINTIQ